MVDPDTGGVLDGDAIIVNDTGESHVLKNDVGCVDHGNTVSCDCSIAANDRLVGANSETGRKAELSLDDNVQAVVTLSRVSSHINIPCLDPILTVTAAIKAASAPVAPAVIVVVGPPAPPLTGPIGLSLPKPTRSKAPVGSGSTG